MAAPVGQQNEGAFQSRLLDVVGTPDGFLGKNIAYQQIPALLEEIVSSVAMHHPAVRDANVVTFSALSTFLSDKIPEIDVCPAIPLSGNAVHLLEVMGEKFPVIKEYFFGLDAKSVQIDDISATVFTHEVPHDPRQAIEVYEFVRSLLSEQSECIVSAEQKANPNKPANGLFSEITVNNFYEVIESAGAELLIVRNHNRCFGVYIYFNRGQCAPEDRKFFDRSRETLTLPVNQEKIIEQFGVPFDPESCASVFGVFISRDVQEKLEADGGDIARGIVYDAFNHHMLTELAEAPDHPKWILGWVRTYPNPNTAIDAHIARCYYDTGIELPFSEDGDLRLKLLLINLDQLAVHGPNKDEYPIMPLAPSKYMNESNHKVRRMRESAAMIRCVDWDNPPFSGI